MAFGIDDAIAAGLKIVDKFIPDPDAKIKAEAELRSSLQAWDKAQTDTNIVEAGHRSIYIAGWRPFIGWTCGLAFGMHFVGFPLINFGLIWAQYPPVMVAFDMDTLMTVLMGMLGFGGLRTFEKLKGLTK